MLIIQFKWSNIYFSFWQVKTVRWKRALRQYVAICAHRPRQWKRKVLTNISAYVTLPIFYPRPPKLLHRYICRFCDILLLCGVKFDSCGGAWGKITQTSKKRMILSKNLPQTSKKFTRINPPNPWHFATLHSHTGHICLTFLHCAFANVSLNHLHKKRQSHTGYISLLCIFKWVSNSLACPIYN